jgi:outer membrane protein assembly factor BamB
VTTAFGVPSVVDGKLFVGAADGMVYALDAATRCVYWTYAAAAGVRVAPVIRNGAAYFGDLRGNVYAVNAGTGSLLGRRALTLILSQSSQAAEARSGPAACSGLRPR